ncbi:MAG: uridine kinase [Candidatus Melainabacteria bacterium]|nr:uridine kinase [Candidatus Melainabacteria bacterium]
MATPRLVIGIAGGTGSGKTTLAERLLETFQDRAVLIKQDDYYKDHSHLTKEQKTKHNFDHPDAIDFDLLKKHLLLLKDNQSIEVPVYNFCTSARELRTQRVNPAEIVIVEGILLFVHPEIRDLCDLKIYVETDDDVRLLRRIERDMRDRARDFQSVRDQYMATVKPMHDAYVEPSKRHADIIIPTVRRNENGVALIVASLKKDLDFLAHHQKRQREIRQ